MRDSSESDGPDGRFGTGHPADEGSGPGDHDGTDRDRERFRGHPPGDEPRVVEPDTDDEGAVIADDEGGNVAGPSPGSVRMPVEPGSPSLEHTLFVLLGVVLTLLVFARLAGV